MAHYQVTVDCDLLQGLFIRDDGLARLVENIVNQILDAQATEQLRAKPYERTEERQGYRNGYRDKLLKSRVGELTLMVPRLRSGHFSTELFERYQRSEQALLLAMVEMVVNGVSTRKVRAVVDELWVKSYILCKFVLVSGNGLMHFSYFLLKAIDFRA
ncbi:transposase mutator type [Thermovirga lienii DSM 17291]|uniref:Mutator family transposase n=1 Tax=Thermovirga lienii (strain ATCC BAA-1197 / DSM 17291 / Cas60314) TaxID=580340 RepID=G7V983_THELD|nr:transposase mutator type [Thermovirga lienii DSM 17291]